MDIVERIKKLCKDKKTSMNALEKELGFGNGSIRMWDKKVPGSDKVILVAQKLDVSLDYLLTGKEVSDLTSDEQLLIEYYRFSDERSKKMILATAAAGADQEHEQVKITSSDSKIG